MVAMIRMIATTIRSSRSEKPLLFFMLLHRVPCNGLLTSRYKALVCYCTGAPEEVPGKHGLQVADVPVA
jgi:hypothetical protein